MIHFVCIDDLTGEVAFALEVDHPDDGPARFIMPAPPGKRFVKVDEPFVRIDGPLTMLPFLIDGIVQWVETASLEDMRAAKRDEINAAWVVADSTAFTYGGHSFRAGQDDVLRLNCTNGYISLKREMPPGWIGVWKTMAEVDTFIELPDVASWEPFYTAFVLKGLNNYLVAQSLKARIAAARTNGELEVIKWPA